MKKIGTYSYDETKWEARPREAERVKNFIEKYCTHVKGDKAGQPLILDQWQIDNVIMPAFGLYYPGTDRRRFKTIYMEVPKGNAKSTLGAAIALYLLIIDVDNGAEVYSVASDTDQARIIYSTATGMIQQNKKLSESASPFRYSIIKPSKSSFYKVLSGSPRGKHGFIPSGIVFDELHEQPDRELWDTLTAGMMKRTNSMCFAFTTAGTNRESICYELHEKAVKIQKGQVEDESFLGIIFNADKDDDIHSEEVWRKANPGYGTIIDKDAFRVEYNKIKSTPSYESTFRRLHLNQWVESRSTWITDEAWQACNLMELPDFDDWCYGGIDLASVSDFTAFSVLMPKDGILHLKTYYWLPEDKYMDGEFGIDYTNWGDYILTNPGNVTDHRLFADFVMEKIGEYKFKLINYDPYIANSMFMQHLIGEMGDKAVGDLFNPHNQSIKYLSEPTKEFERLILQKKINHAGDPVLRWMVTNVLLYTDPAGRNVKVNKEKAKSKIDGVVSGIMSLAGYMMQDKEESVYQYRGIRSV